MPHLAELGVDAFVREVEGERVPVALNFAAGPAAVSLPSNQPTGTILLASGGGRDGEKMRLSFALRAHEGAVVALSP